MPLALLFLDIRMQSNAIGGMMSLLVILSPFGNIEKLELEAEQALAWPIPAALRLDVVFVFRTSFTVVSGLADRLGRGGCSSRPHSARERELDAAGGQYHGIGDAVVDLGRGQENQQAGCSRDSGADRQARERERDMSYPVHELVGASPALGDVIDCIGKVARLNRNVLLEGESGTGKELVARTIHRNSRGANCPFVAINCSRWMREESISMEIAGCNALENEMSCPIEHSFVGSSAALAKVLRFIGQVTRSNSTVLIYGESGTGKELAARAIHHNSMRPGMFVALNCAALSEGVLESELFGHEKGSFTGATRQQIGRFELARLGTLFLDEIGEMSPAIQPKLLRALEAREIDRVGGTQPVPVDIRLIAATNRDLDLAVAAGTFRQDLYYRLNVVPLRMPSLRERREDISELVQYFIGKYGNTGERTVCAVSAEAESILCEYDWPGNVRELQNVIQRACVLGSGDTIKPADLPEGFLKNTLSPSHPGTEMPTYEEFMLDIERQIVKYVLRLVNGNYSDAAAMLGRHPRGMYRLLERLNLPQLKKRNA
jgi:DNA-binding NtrC family response regulator